MEFSQTVSQASYCKFSPNSELFAYSQAKRTYVSISPRMFQIKECSIDLRNHAVITTNSFPSDIAFSPNSQFLALLFKDKGQLLIYHVDGTSVGKIEDTQAGMSGMLWVPDSCQIIVFTEMLYKCSIYNLSNKTISFIKSPKMSTAKGCQFSQNGKFMALLERHDCKDFIGIYFVGDWKLMNTFPLESFDVVEIKWGSNNSYIVAWENIITYRFYAICPFRGVALRYQPYDYALGIKSVAYSNTSSFVAIGSFDQKIRLINAKTWKFICQLDCSNAILNSNNTKIYREDDSNKDNNRMKEVESQNYKIPSIKVSSGEKNDKPPVQGVGLLQFSPDDTMLACRNDNMPYTVFIWDISSLQIETVLTLNSHVKMIKWHHQENTLCIVSATDRALFWKSGVIYECSFPLSHKFNIQRFLWSQDSKKMLLFEKNQFIYADLIPEENQ